MTQDLAYGYTSQMRYLILLFVLAASLAACGDLPVGPVNHDCVGNPMKSQGSGCNDSHHS
jgi:hypothetical protein